jgi:hypothetical protein
MFARKLSKLFIVPIMLFSSSSPDSAEIEMVAKIKRNAERNFIFSTYMARSYTTIIIFSRLPGAFYPRDLFLR